MAHELRSPSRLARGESPPDLSLYPFIEVRSPVGQARVAELVEEFDRGESEAIVFPHSPKNAATGERSTEMLDGAWRWR